MGLFDSGGEDAAEAMMFWLQQGKKSYEKEMRPIADLGFGGYQEMGALLGLEGDRAAAIERFQQTPGLQFARDEALKATSRQAAASGLTGSGNVLAALQQRAMDLTNQQFGTYLGQLGTFAQPGLTAKQNIADMEWQFAQGMGQAAAAEEKAKAAESSAKWRAGLSLAVGAATGGLGMGAAGAMGMSGMSGAGIGMLQGLGSSMGMGGMGMGGGMFSSPAASTGSLASGIGSIGIGGGYGGTPSYSSVPGIGIGQTGGTAWDNWDF